MDFVSQHALIVIAAATLAAHGLLLSNDGLYWDSLWIFGLQRPDRIHLLLAHCSQAGNPLIGQLYKGMSLLPNSLFHSRMAALASILLIGVLTRAICLASGFFSEPAALGVALLTVTYTGNQMLIDFSIFIAYYLFQVLFLAGILLAFQAANSTSYTWIPLYLASVTFIFIGFSINSHLTYYFAFPLTLLAQYAFLPETTQTTSVLLRNMAAFGFLPFVFWLLKERLTPRWGYYRSHNRVAFDYQQFKEHAVRAIQFGLLGAVAEPFRYIFRHLPGALALIPALAAAWFFHEHSLISLNTSLLQSLGMIAAGAVLFVLGAFPYVAVRQPAGLRGWSTKNNILYALPTALLLTGALSLVLKGAWFSAAAGFMAAIFAIYLALLHLHWLALWAKYRSFLRNLSLIPRAQETGIFAFTDIHPISGAFDEHPEFYSIYATFLLDLLWKDLRRLAIVEPIPRTQGYTPLEVAIVKKSTTLDFALTSIDLNAPQASVVLGAAGANPSPPWTGLRYAWHRAFHAQGMDSFLAGLTCVGFTPLDKPRDIQPGRSWPPGVAPFVARWRKDAEEELNKN